MPLLGKMIPGTLNNVTASLPGKNGSLSPAGNILAMRSGVIKLLKIWIYRSLKKNMDPGYKPLVLAGSPSQPFLAEEI